MNSSIPILTYHSLDASGSVISVTPSVFRHQVELLHDRGFRGISLATLLDAWEGRTKLPPRAVVFTFDDGYRNLLDHALPVLRERGFSATVFALAGRCGGDNRWPGQPMEIPRLPLLTANELRQIAQEGIEIGSHGLTHAPLTEVSQEKSQQEIRDSRSRLEDLLGLPVRVFAPPHGLLDPYSSRAIRATYRAACGTRLGLSNPQDDRHALRRVEMYYFQTLSTFRLLLGPWCRSYLRLRATGRRFRAALFDMHRNHG